MTVSRRLAAVEGSLDPVEIVLRVIAEAQENPSLEAYARAIAEIPVEAAPMSRIASDVEASVRRATKGPRGKRSSGPSAGSWATRSSDTSSSFG